jgi:hypothetical protein
VCNYFALYVALKLSALRTPLIEHQVKFIYKISIALVPGFQINHGARYEPTFT